MQDLSVPSLRLQQILRTYCWGLDPAGIADLRASVETGHYPWLRGDLAQAIAGADAPPGWWDEAVGESGSPSAAAQRDLWRRLFPGDALPGT